MFRMLYYISTVLPLSQRHNARTKCVKQVCLSYGQADHLSGKPVNVRQFYRCQRNVSNFSKNQGIVMGKILSGKIVQKFS